MAGEARQAVAALAGGDIDEVSRVELLLSDISAIFADTTEQDPAHVVSKPVDEIASLALIDRLSAIVPRPWAEYGKSGKPITPNKLARLLKPLGIGPVHIGDAQNRIRGYRLTQFKDAFERVLPPATPLSNRASAHNDEKSRAYDTGDDARITETNARFQNPAAVTQITRECADARFERRKAEGDTTIADAAPPAEASLLSADEAYAAARELAVGFDFAPEGRPVHDPLAVPPPGLNGLAERPSVVVGGMPSMITRGTKRRCRPSASAPRR